MIDTFICWRDPEHPIAPHPQFGWPRCTTCGAAPPYHQRPQYLPENFSLGIYLPTESTPLAVMIAPGSAIVGIEKPDLYADGQGRTLIYFEGYTVMLPSDLVGKEAYQIWEAGMATAASRIVTDYPTIAASTPRNRELLRVGTYYVKSAVFDIADPYRDALNRWMAESPHVRSTA